MRNNKMRKLRALDLFSGGGGACIGMQQAGFEVVGIDIKPHVNYPGDFIQADALNPPVDLNDFDFVWASPPCQRFSMAGKRWGDRSHKHPNLIPPTRHLLAQHPYTCIENVPQAPLRPDLYLWGVQVGLEKLWRKRVFELTFWVWDLPTPRRTRDHYYTITGNLSARNHFYKRKTEGLPGTISVKEAKEIMGIPANIAMTKREVVESVPPAYAFYIATVANEQIRSESNDFE